MDERRLGARWSVGDEACVRFRGEDAPFDSKVEDISFKGLRVRAPYALNKGEILTVNIALTTEVFLDAEASVVWNEVSGEEHLCGLCFSRIRDMDKEKIYRYIRHNYPEQIKNQQWSGIIPLTNEDIVL